MTSKVAYLWQFGLFFSAAPTAQNRIDNLIYRFLYPMMYWVSKNYIQFPFLKAEKSNGNSNTYCIFWDRRDQMPLSVGKRNVCAAFNYGVLRPIVSKNYIQFLF